MSNGGQPAIDLRAVFGIVLILLCFVMFVLAYDNLRNDLAPLLFAGAMIACIVSVILFSLVPSSANPYLKAGVGLGGAALFFTVIYNPIMDEIAHPNITVAGGVYYQLQTTNQSALRPVKKATVEIPYTGLSSATNDVGEFAIAYAPPGVKRLFVEYMGNIYPIELSQYKDTRYPVIPPDASASAADVLPPQTVLDQLHPDQKLTKSSWVYLGLNKDGKWLQKNFDVSGQPQTNGSLQAAVDVYRRDDKPRQSGVDWELGNVQGVLKQGDTVKIIDTEKIPGDAGVTHWWANIQPQ